MNYFNTCAKDYETYIKAERLASRELFSIIKNRFYDKVLEVACGTGIFTKNLTQIARRIYAIDISKDMLEMAKTKHLGGTRFIEFDANNLQNFPLKNFDLIVSASGINYLDSPDNFTQNSFNLLSYNGAIAFSAYTEGTYKEVYSCIDTLPIKTRFFYETEYWIELLRLTGFKNISYKTKTLKLFSPSGLHVIKLLSKTTDILRKQDNTPLSTNELKILAKSIEKKYLSQLGIPLTYNIIYISGLKIVN